jgi:cytochrome P450/NADPH-cytochrome P450 reductase
MNYRFNSFYNDGPMHPFVAALNMTLTEVDARAWRFPISNQVRFASKKKFDRNVGIMRQLTGSIIKQRRENPTKEDDLLASLMEGEDPETKTKLSDELLADNLLTFLGAGHETTSGTLSFALYLLIKNPAALVKAQQEIDSVVADEPLGVEHLSKLPYIDAILRETLRLQPTVPGISLTPLEDVVLIDKYVVKKDAPIYAMFFPIHRDPKVYGNDADEFRPERMLREAFQKLPQNSWKPFGNGSRACIGRPFAWQESQIVGFCFY